MVQVGFADVGQADLAGRAMRQLYPERALQLRDLLADQLGTAIELTSAASE